MAKTTNDEPVALPADELTLTEFCTRLSARDRRVELIGGFHASQRAAERHKDTEAAYQAAFDAFATQPV